MMYQHHVHRSPALLLTFLSAVTCASVTPARAQQFDDHVRFAARAAATAARAAERGRVEQRRDMRSDRTDRRTETLSIGANGTLELRNVSGDITVRTGSGRDVVIEIVRESRGRTDADAARGLTEVQPRIDHRGERASIDVDYPRGGNMPYQVTVHFEVTAPAGTRLSARSVSGNVSVTGIKGDVAAEVISGNVTIANSGRVSKANSVSGNITLTGIQNDDTLTAGTVSGNVRLTDVQARMVSADVTSGNVRAENVRCNNASLKSLSGTVEFSGRLSANGRYELQSHSGSVRFNADGPVGFTLQASSFSGDIEAGQVSLSSVSKTRGALRATVGDGSAVVVLQTFSGTVTIGRR